MHIKDKNKEVAPPSNFSRSGIGDFQGETKVMFFSFLNDEDGQTLVEYGLLMSLIALAIIGALTLMGTRVRNMWGNNAGKYPDPAP